MMDSEKLKIQIGANIAAYRKRGNLTQAGLAEKLNYSDKAVSKWERGESVPDVMTLVQLADLIGKSDRTVKRITVSLEAKGLIERVGGKRFGYWKVNAQ